MTGNSKVLVLASEPYLPGSSLQELIQEHQLELETLTVLTNSATLQSVSVPQQAFQKAVSLATAQGHHTPALLGSIATTLTPGAKLTVYEPANSKGSEGSVVLKKALLLAGFVDSTDTGVIKTSQGQQTCVSLPLHASLHGSCRMHQSPTYLLAMQLTASKPTYAVGAKASISLKPKQQAKQTSWTVAAEDDDDELLDEDELLTEEDRQRPTIICKLVWVILIVHDVNSPAGCCTVMRVIQMYLFTSTSLAICTAVLAEGPVSALQLQMTVKLALARKLARTAHVVGQMQRLQSKKSIYHRT